jgi:CubicO group peptidase (beta-lactamase class C family)
MKHFISWSLRLILIAGLALGWLGGAASPALAEIPAASGQAVDLTPQDVENFMDGVIAAQLAGYNIPGAQVAVVKNGEVILLKGYGYANLAARTPVDPAAMQFHPGSISKLFTWTAVMQLVEQGQIDLNADVNTYLTDFKIPDAYGKPITLLNLMSHTPGFEDVSRNLFASSYDEIVPLGQYLAQNMPQRVYPPGDVSAYSNYGTALAGYIVAQVSGESYEDYMAAHIFKPLGMTRSTFSQNPAQVKQIPGYAYSGGQYVPIAPEFVNAAPAGALSSPAGDMAKFMLAHLGDGNGILKPETLKLMHLQHYTAVEGAPGWAHGFMEFDSNGQRLLMHAGDTSMYHSNLWLLPEQGVGVYVSYNGSGGTYAREALIEAFMDRYYPSKSSPAPEPPADFASRAADYAGFYALARGNYSSGESVMRLMQGLNIQVGPDNTILIPNILSASGGSSPYVEIKPGVLQNRYTGERVFFTRSGSSGPYERVIPTFIQGFVGLRAPWHADQPFNLTLLIAGLLMALTAVLIAPIGLFGMRTKAPADEMRSWLRHTARWSGLVWGLLSLVYVIWFVAWVSQINTNIAALNNLPIALSILPWITSLLALGLAGLCVMAWRNKFWGLSGRIHYSLIALSALGLLWFEFYWHLLGW